MNPWSGAALIDEFLRQANAASAGRDHENVTTAEDRVILVP